MVKRNSIVVDGTNINISSNGGDDYICLTDMVGGKNDNTRASDVIKNWIRNRSTIEFLGTWEILYNKDFKVVEFDHFKKEAGLPTFTLSISNWVEMTNARGIYSVKGRYGGTYAHKDIAFEFGSAISPVFKLLIIKEYQRLKEIENNKYNLEWDVRRILSKANYHFHTDAVQKHIIPNSKLQKNKIGIEYVIEADLLNMSVYGYTADDWKKVNKEQVEKGLNMRDFSSVNELIVMTNIESFNAEMIKKNISNSARFGILKKTAKEQLEKLKNMDLMKSVRKQNSSTYIKAEEMTGDELKEITSKSILEKNIENIEKFKEQKKLSDFDKKLKKGLEFNPKKEK